MAVPEDAIDGVDDFAGRGDVAPDEGDESHHQQRVDQVGVLSGDGVDGADLSYVGDFVLVENDLLEGEGDSEEGRKGLLDAVSVLPALLALVGLPDGIALLGSNDGLLEHLVQNVVIFDPDRGRPLDEGEDHLQRRYLALVHQVDQLEGVRILDHLFGLGGYVLKIGLEFVVFAGDALIELISDEFRLSVGLALLI